MSSLRTAEDGHPGLYVLGWPLPGDTTVPRVAYRTALAVPILSREGGYLLAIPLDFLPSDVLVGGLNLEEDGVVGPSMTLEVPAVEEDEVGEEVETGTMITVLLVDFTREVERGMTEFDPELGLREIQPFWQDAPEVLPSSKSLVESAIEWSRSEMDSRVHYLDHRETKNFWFHQFLFFKIMFDFENKEKMKKTSYKLLQGFRHMVFVHKLSF